MTDRFLRSGNLLTSAPFSLLKLNQAIESLDRELDNSADCVQFDVIRNIAIEPLEANVRFRLLEDGVRCNMGFGGYGAMEADLLDPQSDLLRSPDSILVSAISIQKLDPQFGLPGWNATACIESLESLFTQCLGSKAKTILVNNFPLPPLAQPGKRFIGSRQGVEQEIARINEFVEEWVSDHAPRFCLVDWAKVARSCGEENTYDYRYLYMSSMPFKRVFLDGIALEIRAVLRALRGMTKKVLVLDCDNTLWGGVVGEVGRDGINLHPHDYPGNVFYEFQKSVLQLHQNGTLICLCSKNNEEDVLNVLENHEWSLIRKEHIAAYRVNWEEKPANLEALAKELNLGLDSFVFIDDNPREVESVLQMLPQVTTIQVPTELHEYAQLLSRDSLFDKLSVGTEDRIRTTLYQQERARADTRKAYVTYEDYLASLDQRVEINVDSQSDVNRIAELTQKTNQFNLTTIRYTVQDIASFMERDDTSVYSMSAVDKFGALGLIGVMIVRIDGNVGTVDSLLMSCRALQRGLEEFFVLNAFRMERERRSIDEWRGLFSPTAKNKLASGFWPSLGFSPGASATGETTFHAHADAMTVEPPAYIELTNGFSE